MFEAVRQNSAYRSVRYSTIRKDVYTPDVSQKRLSIISAKQAATIQSTICNSRTIPLKAQTATNFYNFNPQRQNYLQSFHSMFQSQKKVKDKKDEPMKVNSLKVKFQNFDDTFLKEDGTQFTLLDPFHRPHTYLVNELKKQQKQLASQRDDLRLLRAEINAIKQNVINSLKNSEDEGMKGMEKIRHLIRKNQIQSQQTRMRIRREITQLYQKHDQNVNLQQELKNRSKGMQRDIFNCQPFELQVELEQKE